VPGDEAVPDGRIEQCMEATLVRGRRKVCQRGISDGQKERRNRDGFLYSDRRSTAGGEAVRCQLREVGRGRDGSSCNRATGRKPRR